MVKIIIILELYIINGKKLLMIVFLNYMYQF